MKRKTIFFISAVLTLSQSICAQHKVKPAVNDALSRAETMHITNFVGTRLDAAYQNGILARDVETLIRPFTQHDEHSCWQSEFWGKWFTSAVLAYQYKPTPELSRILKKAVDGLIATQTKEGYIGNYAPESRLDAWDIWGRKYCMLGLIAYYDLTKDKKALNAAAKEADYLIGELGEKKIPIVKLGNHRGMAASSVLEPACQLYVRTGNKKYLDFAEEIVRQWETPEGPQLISKADVPVEKRFPKPAASEWYSWKQGQKAYEMMSCYEGLLELYRITGDETYKKAVEETWQSILDTEINIAGSGAAMEAWFSGKGIQQIPIAHYQETCVTVTWIKLSQQLLRLTGEPKYADAVEQAFYNALLGAMRPDGSDWAKYTPLSGQRLQGSEQCQMGMNCCVASGPRGLFAVPQHAAMENAKGATVNLYFPGDYQLKSPLGKHVTLKQSTDYPISGKVEVEVFPENEEHMTLSFRIPQWSAATKVFVNGNEVQGAMAGTYLTIDRQWKESDKVTLEFDMRGKIHTIGNTPACFAITRGPVVLTRDERLPGPSLEAVIEPLKNKEGFIELKPATQHENGIWMVFSAKFLPEAYTEYGANAVDVQFCDYASAGNTNSSFPFFKVWMPQLFDPRK